jgi:hypothetical protein
VREVETWRRERKEKRDPSTSVGMAGLAGETHDEEGVVVATQTEARSKATFNGKRAGVTPALRKGIQAFW